MNTENNEVSITFSVATWNVIMNALGQRPFIEVAQLIAEIQTQAKMQVAKPQAPVESE